MRGLLRIVDRFEEYCMAAALLLMTIVTCANVFLRYVFDSGLVWSIEATTYAFGWLTLVGMAYGVRTNAHIAINAAVAHLSTRQRRVAAVAALVICVAYGCLMLYGSVVFVQRLVVLGNAARDIPVPRWLLSLAMPLGFGLLLLRLVQSSTQLFGHSTKQEP
jgi:C4-dicarboxylate transporter DctQ subunit